MKPTDVKKVANIFYEQHGKTTRPNASNIDKLSRETMYNTLADYFKVCCANENGCGYGTKCGQTDLKEDCGYFLRTDFTKQPNPRASRISEIADSTVAGLVAEINKWRKEKKEQTPKTIADIDSLVFAH